MKFTIYKSKLACVALVVALSGLLAGCASHNLGQTGATNTNSVAQLRHKLYISLESQGVNVFHRGETVTLVMPSEHVFAYMSSELNPAYAPVLRDAARLIKTYSIVTVKVAAYSSTNNKTLTTTQAKKVLRCLEDHHINVRLLYAVGYGNKGKVASNKTFRGRQANYRVEISFRYYPPYNPYS